jgi:hypothetical protein
MEAALDDWNLPWEGGCRCGEIRLRVTAPPLLASACHCTGCQRMSASAFSLTLTLAAGALEVTAGETRRGGAHSDGIYHQHCPRCGAWLFTRADMLGEMVNLRPSTLDDHGWFVPFAEFFIGEKLPWASTPARHSFTTVPEMEAFGPLVEAFAREGARPRST